MNRIVILSGVLIFGAGLVVIGFLIDWFFKAALVIAGGAILIALGGVCAGLLVQSKLKAKK